MRFPAYSQKQLSVILSETLLARRLQIYVNNYKYTAVKHSIEGRREERKEDEDNGGPDDNYCRREEDVLHVIDSVVVRKLLDMVKQSISETFTRMLDAALPLLMNTTTHPTVLFEASLTCFEFCSAETHSSSNVVNFSSSASSTAWSTAMKPASTSAQEASVLALVPVQAFRYYSTRS